MANEFLTRLKAVDQANLTPLVRKALENNLAEVVDWSYQPVGGGGAQVLGLSHGVYRFKGTARIQDIIVPWSLILKTVKLSISEPHSDIPSHSLYWKREVFVYQSGLLDGLPGDLIAPRCFKVVEQAGDEYWIWLEDIPDETSIWPLERYGLAARHLGQFNGACFVGRPLPDKPWLSTGRVRDWLEDGEPALRDLRNLMGHPLAQRWLRGDSVDRLLGQWAEKIYCLRRLIVCLAHYAIMTLFVVT